MSNNAVIGAGDQLSEMPYSGFGDIHLQRTCVRPADSNHHSSLGPHYNTRCGKSLFAFSGQPLPVLWQHM